MDNLSSALGQIEGTYESLKSVASGLTSSLVFNNDNSIDKLKTELEAAIEELESAVGNIESLIDDVQVASGYLPKSGVVYYGE